MRPPLGSEGPWVTHAPVPFQPFPAPGPTPRSLRRGRPPSRKPPAGVGGCPPSPPSRGPRGRPDGPTYFDGGAERPQSARPQPCLCRAAALPGRAAAPWTPAPRRAPPEPPAPSSRAPHRPRAPGSLAASPPRWSWTDSRRAWGRGQAKPRPSWGGAAAGTAPGVRQGARGRLPAATSGRCTQVPLDPRRPG